jgi:hypothetical protein
MKSIAQKRSVGHRRDGAAGCDSESVNLPFERHLRFRSRSPATGHSDQAAGIMKGSRRPQLPSLAVVIATALLGFCSPAHAIVIDFNEIPDGTLLSAGDPYDSVLDLQGQSTAFLFTPPDVITPISTASTITNVNVPFRSGDSVVQTLSPFVDGAFKYSAQVTGTFLQPVVDVSFDAFANRTAGYSYTGADDVGNILSLSGTIIGNIESGGLLDWQRIDLTLPVGYHLTSFDVANSDPGPSDGAVWIDNISFALIPEPSAVALIATGAIAMLLKRRRQS